MASFTLAEAEQILAAAKAKVIAMGAKMSIAVVDPRGDLITMCRTDGASWRTPPISRAKAVAAACFGRASGELTDNAMSPVFRGLMAMEGGHMIPGQGALPVYRNGELLGAVGGSGGTAQQDEDAARAGSNALGLATTPSPHLLYGSLVDARVGRGPWWIVTEASMRPHRVLPGRRC